MKPHNLTVLLILLYLMAFVVSATNRTPEVSPTSKDLLVHDQSLPVAVRKGSYILDSFRGFREWPLEVVDSSSATVSSICSSMIEPGRFLLASLDGTILSVDCKTGIQWSFQTGSALSYSEQVISEINNSGCFLYSGEDWNLYEYCTGSGFRKLNLTIEEYVHNTPEIQGTEITIGSKMATMYLLDADSGEELHKDQTLSNRPGISSPKFGNKLVSSKLEMGKRASNYIIMVRTDYYLNSSVLGKPKWNMMESRISATYVNNEIPNKAVDDLNLMYTSQKDIPVYFLRKMNNALMAGSGVPMLPSASNFPNNFAADAQNIYQKQFGMPQIVHETTGSDQNLQGLENFHCYAFGDSFKDANECSYGNCVMYKPFESEIFNEVAVLQPQLNRFTNGLFENDLGTPEDSFMIADNLKLDEDRGIQWNLKTRLLETGLFLIFIALPIVLMFVMYFWKRKEPTKSDRKLINRMKPSLAPKKKKARKAVNVKSSSVATNHDSIIASGKHYAETNEHSSIQNSDSNLMNLLRGNGVGEGRCVGKLFVSNTVIGRGSNGTVVFEGVYDGRAVAVKRLLRAHHDIAFKEIQNLIASDRHPNIVRWYGVEQDLDFVYISLERCISSLSDLIQLDTDCPSPTNSGDYMNSSYTKEHKIILPTIKGVGRDIQLWRSNGLPSPQLLKLMRDLVSGVAHLHELGIIHRDLKPQNVLISDGKILTAKVSDMGISKRLLDDMSSLSHHATGHGSSGWRAPEQLRRGRQTRAVDLFSLGCILFFCITKGEHPFGKYYERDGNIMNNRVDLFLVDHIPEAVDLLLKLLNSEPTMRPNAVEALHHPFFWSSEMRLSFLRDISDRIELEDRENESELLKELENVGATAFGGKWGEKLDAAFINDMGRYRKYNFGCLRDLLRVIRNKLNHYRELSKELKEILGPVPEGFDQYFSTRFPKLLIEVYKVVCLYCKEEDSFRKYFDSSLI
ncbi:serine/threonine-protein kinase/endoribonuclease IRE1a isoform X1 [Dendrobium catenatum]|uniref:non-specific serine/threonine protein kinase n=1 Tax=Dendrobium catenatum TaxID=906689 RepID=A0A2I0WTK2_9ASPA|nr:serine/threonine-protein kinase/endoribonuclease IRE1a isoform X1 [Dendrobium catenatum]PKU78986.1 Serine/threonine-protein kinase/endoribonuclease IRE1a [Dendrobium catenatum]